MPNKEYKFSRFLTGTKWIAKHFAITSKNLGKTRYYSVCLCLNPIIYTKHKMLLDNIAKAENGDTNLALPVIREEELYSSSLELYIKKYDFPGTLSKYIHEYDTKLINLGDMFVVGPIGVGLDVDEGSLKGVHVCMAGGTGAYCFLDMVAYVLRYMVSEINKRVDGLSNNFIDSSENFSDISNSDFTLVYMTSFSNHDDGVYTDVCTQLQILDEKYNLNKFKFINRFSDDTPKPPRWNQSFLNEQLGQYQGKISKVFLCGPTPFLDDSKENLLKSGLVQQNQIKFV